MGPIEACVRNPVKVSVGVLLVALFGGIALVRMPMQLTPEVQIPTLTVETRWPGASPQEVEREIVQEQEDQLKSVEGLAKMSSESLDSLGRVTLEFRVGTDMREALLKVNTRLEQVREYPVDADEPVIRTANLSDRPIGWFILSPRLPAREAVERLMASSPDLAAALEPVRSAPNGGVALYRLRRLVEARPELEEDLREILPPDVDVTGLRKFAEDVIEARLERVDGVSDANIMGGREEEMQVILDPQRLAARSITMTDVRAALRAQNQDTSGGDFWEGKRRYIVRTLGQFRSPGDVESALLAYRDGAPVYVRDVGEVKHGHKKPEGLVRRFGTRTIAMSVLRETGANVLDVMDGIRGATAELNAGILRQRGLQFTQVYDETEYIHSAVGLVKDNLLVGGLLTVAVLLLFLRSGRSTLVIGLAIPTSIVGAFLVLHLLGRSLNVVSLAGLAFAVGMLVDNAVVVLENIFRRHQMGEDPFRASVRGTKEVWGAVLASTLTTLAVFIPVLFVEEEAGQLFRDIALAISAGVGLSLIVSIAVIPVAAARLLGSGGRAGRPRSRGPASLARAVLRAALLPFDLAGGTFVRAVLGANGLLSRSVLARLAVVLGFVAASVWLSLALMPKVEYLPTGDRNLVIGLLLPPPGYNVDQMMSIGGRIEEALRPYWDVDPASPEAASLDYPPIADYFFVARDRQLFLGLRAADPPRARELIPLIRAVAGEIPGTFVVARQTSLFEQGLSGGRTIDVEIRGPDLVRLTSLGGEVLERVRAVVPGSQAIPQPSLDLSTPEIHIVPKREHAAGMGLTAGDLGYILDALVDGAYATDYFIGGDKIDLRIIGRAELANRTQDLEALPIATRTGDLVPLKALGDVILTSGPEQINHRERLRAITIRVTPPAEFPLETAMERIEAEIVRPLLEGDDMGDGLYQIYLSGTADKLHATWRALRLNFLLAILITYLLMAALFESWLYPFVIIASVPLGTVGGFAGLWLLNRFVLQPLDVLTMLGFVILIGTVVNNPILIVEQTLVHMREEGMPMRAALLESLRNRIRPIFMTMTTTVFGLLPLVLFPGSGSELYRGIGAVVLGGLIASTLVTLVVVPSLFSLAMEAKEGLLRLMGRAPGPAPEREEREQREPAPPPVRRRPAPAELEPEMRD